MLSDVEQQKFSKYGSLQKVDSNWNCYAIVHYCPLNPLLCNHQPDDYKFYWYEPEDVCNPGLANPNCPFVRWCVKHTASIKSRRIINKENFIALKPTIALVKTTDIVSPLIAVKDHFGSLPHQYLFLETKSKWPTIFRKKMREMDL